MFLHIDFPLNTGKGLRMNWLILGKFAFSRSKMEQKQPWIKKKNVLKMNIHELNFSRKTMNLNKRRLSWKSVTLLQTFSSQYLPSFSVLPFLFLVLSIPMCGLMKNIMNKHILSSDLEWGYSLSQILDCLLINW